MRRIFEYALEVVDYQEIHLPSNAKILAVDVQIGVVCLWALVDPEETVSTRTIKIVGTGHAVEEIDGEMDYIGTIQLLGGTLIFHVFEIVG